MIESVKQYATGARKRGLAGIGTCPIAFYTGDMDWLVLEWVGLSIAGRNALGRRQEESGMLEKGPYRLMWQGMEKCYGEPKRARSRKRWIRPR